MPGAFRRLHPKFKTPWLAILLFAGIAPIVVILPGSVNFVGTLYSFGATLSFTVAHASLVALRVRYRDEEVEFRAKPNLRIRGVEWPLFAIVGGIATGISFLVILVQNSTTRWVGLGWIVLGLALYTLYRRRYVHASLAVTTKAPPLLGPAIALEYLRILVPIVSGPESRESVDLAARLAAERRATIVALRVIVVGPELSLDADLSEEATIADRLLDEAHAIAELYGVRMIERIVRARHAGRAIVEEADRRQTEIIVLGAPRGRHREIFGKTVDYVLKNAPCRVMVAAGRQAA
jgi:APA family basic amino acid/polyamine antiporter